jgi:Protein of unknown function (DUF2924)
VRGAAGPAQTGSGNGSPLVRSKQNDEAERDILRFAGRTRGPRTRPVMVMADGFAWNGQTYDSLSKVAFAITGTKWNGPRFFGMRDKEDRPAMEARP